ncbi:sialic acid-binding Ig-like lectin 7 [Engystomops pustulosus]|uniref:sialic acid-binding Ig-like lectin 7 n=1 Tax=Engystomops pustulosus TaxID=76066 RepID=UPI003AFA1EEA
MKVGMTCRSIWSALTAIILCPLWRGVTCQVIHDPGYSITVASSVRVQEGLCVSIPCTFTAAGVSTFTNSIIYWRRGTCSEYVTVATNNKTFTVHNDNFQLMGNPDSGNCTLAISHAKKEDSGEYYIRYENNVTKIKYNYCQKTRTSITVNDLGAPVISDLKTEIGGAITVTCSPPVNCSSTSLVIQWKKSNVDGIWKNSSTTTFTPSGNDQQESITCEMTNFKGTTTRNTILVYEYVNDTCPYERRNPVYSWMNPVLTGGGILTFLVFCIIGAVFAFKRSGEKKTATSNNYTMENSEYKKNKDPAMRRPASGGKKDTKVPYQNSKDVEVSGKDVYANLEEEEEEAIYAN